MMKDHLIRLGSGLSLAFIHRGATARMTTNKLPFCARLVMDRLRSLDNAPTSSAPCACRLLSHPPERQFPVCGGRSIRAKPFSGLISDSPCVHLRGSKSAPRTTPVKHTPAVETAQAYGVTTVMALRPYSAVLSLRPELHSANTGLLPLCSRPGGRGSRWPPARRFFPLARTNSRDRCTQRGRASRSSVQKRLARRPIWSRIWRDGAGGLMPKVPRGLFRRDRGGRTRTACGSRHSYYFLDDPKHRVALASPDAPRFLDSRWTPSSSNS